MNDGSILGLCIYIIYDVITRLVTEKIDYLCFDKKISIFTQIQQVQSTNKFEESKYE